MLHFPHVKGDDTRDIEEILNEELQAKGVEDDLELHQ